MNMQEGNIPFSWENKPGVRKPRERRTAAIHDNPSAKEGRLPPPPCENSKKATSQDLGLPLPPCVFKPSLRSSSRRSKDGDDPFLMAYKECTKSSKKDSLVGKKSFLGSCKYSCSVMDDSIVRVSHVPVSNSDRKRLEGFKDSR